jgi:prepilin-type N-terminal cleavage/methylation domain-containing protein
MRWLRSRKGITLLELMIVVLVFGILSAIAAPRFLGANPRARLGSSASELVSDMRWCRARALAERVDYGIAFDLPNNTFSMFQDINSDGQLNAGDVSVYGWKDLPSRVIFEGPSTFSDLVAMFHANGTSNGGTIILRVSDPEVATPPGRTIDVLPSTGRVTTYSS